MKERCGSWVDWYGERVCDVDTLARLAGHEMIDASNQTSNMCAESSCFLHSLLLTPSFFLEHIPVRSYSPLTTFYQIHRKS